ncbi:MAG: hypothetical protein V7K61_22875 [Nostoc sp.]
MLIFWLSIAIAMQQLPSYFRKITTFLRNSSVITDGNFIEESLIYCLSYFKYINNSNDGS